jgi:uncharacterized membrane protein YgcG
MPTARNLLVNVLPNAWLSLVACSDGVVSDQDGTAGGAKPGGGVNSAGGAIGAGGTSHHRMVRPGES